MLIERTYRFKCYPTSGQKAIFKSWEEAIIRFKNGDDVNSIFTDIHAARSIKSLNFDTSVHKVDYRQLHTQIRIDLNTFNVNRVTDKYRYVSFKLIKNLKVRIHKFHPTLSFKDGKIKVANVVNESGQFFLVLTMEFKVPFVSKPPKPMIDLSLTDRSVVLKDGKEFKIPGEMISFVSSYGYRNKTTKTTKRKMTKNIRRVIHWQHQFVRALLDKVEVRKISKKGSNKMISIIDFERMVDYKGE